MTKEQMERFSSEESLSVLAEVVGSIFGIPVTMKAEVRNISDDGENYLLKFESLPFGEDVLGVLGFGFKNVRVDSFGHHDICDDGAICFQLNFSYEHTDGGYNGCGLFAYGHKIIVTTNPLREGAPVVWRPW
jgi:hypothetical protein